MTGLLRWQFLGKRATTERARQAFNGLKRDGKIPKDWSWKNPEQNTAAGLALIQDLSRKFGGDYQKIAAAYYSGEDVVDKSGHISNFRDPVNKSAPDTTGYVNQIMERIGRVPKIEMRTQVTRPENGAGNPIQHVPIDPNVPLQYQTGTVGNESVDSADMQTLLRYRDEAGRVIANGHEKLKTDLEWRAEQSRSAVNSGLPVPDMVPTLEEAQAAFGDQSGARWHAEKVATTVAIGQGTAAMNNKSAYEINAQLMAAKPKEGSDNPTRDLITFNALQQAAQRVVEAQNKDPVRYLLQADKTVANSYKVMSNIQADPTASPDKKAMSRLAYNNMLVANQQRLGVDKIRLLTDQDTAQIMQRFNDPKNPNPALVVDQLSADYGKHFPTVFQQLADEGKLPETALVIADMRDLGAKTRLGALANVKLPDLKENIGSVTAKVIDDSLMGKMASFGHATANRPDGAVLFNIWSNNTKKLAYSYVAQGVDPEKAAAQAYKETVGANYTFKEGYMIPIERNDKVVESMLNWNIDNLDKLNLRIPIAAPGTYDADNKQNYIDSLKRNHTFVNDEDGGGVYLYNQDRGGRSQLVPVFNNDGKQVHFRFDELEKKNTNMELIKADKSNKFTAGLGSKAADLTMPTGDN
jgi:hypothetical protein